MALELLKRAARLWNWLSPATYARRLLTARNDQTLPANPPARLRKLFGPGVVFAGSMAAPRAVGFLLLPIVTRVLSPAEYGQLSIALAVMSVAMIALAFGVDIVVFRSIVQLEDDPSRKDEFVSNIWTFLIVAPLAVGGVLAGLAFVFTPADAVVTPLQAALAFTAAAAFVAANTMPLAVTRAEHRLADFVRLSLISSVLIPGLTLLSITVFDGGVTGWMIAGNLGSLAMLAVAMVIMPFKRPRRLDRQMVRQTVAEGLPVLPHFLAMWSLQLADRIVLGTLISATALGVYSLGSNAALPVFVLLGGLNQSLMVEYARAGKSGESGRLRGIIELQIGVIVLVSLAGALLGPPAIQLVFDPSYQSAAGLLPWLVLGYALLGLEAIPMNGITLTHGRTRWVWVASIPAAAINLLGIYWLVPEHGITAAAIATAAGYLVLLLIVGLTAHAVGAKLEYAWRPIALLVAIGLATYGIAAATISTATWIDLAVRTVALLLAACACGAVIGRAPLREFLKRARTPENPAS